MSAIIQKFSVADNPQLPGMDPFLFAVHHYDLYPQAKGTTMTPDASLLGHNIGMDFSGKDGWSMYHGTTVPGFPSHPHRGFETISIVEEGFVDHTDAEGAQARYGEGDTQWLTTGAGTAHAEMFPLLHDDGPNPHHMFQIWLNLPPEGKRAKPHFQMFWAEDTPHVTGTDDNGHGYDIKVIAGAFGDTQPLAPPPESWAAAPDSDVAVWVLRLQPGAQLTLPPTNYAETIRTLYSLRGSLTIEGETLVQEGAVLRSTEALDISAGDEGAFALILQGRPIGAPVYQHGPFVANSREELVEAFDAYQRGEFGAWPYESNAPVAPFEEGRFARYPDGTVSRPAN
ncbi:pirin family protein [Corynebacterium amycolatum]|uniref:pirin family protein n=1 Tax=Corynebacterium amycolatum TaxID=43765 RepID=UPI000C7854C5|nr:pirin-like C-terminal cupin domain-containing protein [Corynebacterium amycolatum]MDK7315363.1 pirin-like C-terminal cupin domain-containing protein [Corynebacterium amycolatum]PKZ22814.1 pirin [Corynebacterium amycolatum]